MCVVLQGVLCLYTDIWHSPQRSLITSPRPSFRHIVSRYVLWGSLWCSLTPAVTVLMSRIWLKRKNSKIYERTFYNKLVSMRYHLPPPPAGALDIICAPWGVREKHCASRDKRCFCHMQEFVTGTARSLCNCSLEVVFLFFLRERKNIHRLLVRGDNDKKFSWWIVRF